MPVFPVSGLWRLEAFRGANLKVASAESCTGGLIAKRFTDFSGASCVFWGGFVVYSIEAKERLLGLSRALIEQEGIVSEAIAQAMAAGAIERSGADWSLAVTGYADGPKDRAGLVCIAFAGPNHLSSLCFRFSGSRAAVRRQAAWAAVKGLHKAAGF